MNTRFIITNTFGCMILIFAALAFSFGCEKLALFLISSSISLIIYSAFSSKSLVTIENFILFLGVFYSSGILFLEFTNSNLLLFLMLNVSVLIIYIFLRIFKLTETLKKHKVFLLEKGAGNVTIVPFVAVILLSVGFGILLYIITVKTDMASYIYITRSQRALIYRELGILALFREMLVSGGLLLLYCYFFTKKKWQKHLSIFVLLVAFTHAVVTISRTELILVLIPVLFILIFFDVVTEKFVILSITFIAPFVLFWKSILFILFFNGSAEINYSISESVSWYHIGEDIIRFISSGDVNYLYGNSFIDGLISMVYPFYDTTPLSVWYSKEILSLYNNGSGRGFSMVVESYLNFGFLGPLIVMPFFCFLLCSIFKFFNNTWLYPYVYCITPAFMHKIFRSEFYSLIKTFWWIFIIPLILVLFINFVSNKKQRLSTL